MGIVLKGKEVRENELNKEIEVSFHDLNEKGQQRMFEEDKDLFVANAIISEYKNIREKAENYAYEECSNEILNLIIWKLFDEQGRYTNRYISTILKILNVPRLKLLNTIQLKFARSDNYILKEWLITKYAGVSNDILNIILQGELDKFCDSNEENLVDKIIMNPKFELTLDGKYYGYGRIEKIEARIKELREK